jgi:hypothetical protein
VKVRRFTRRGIHAFTNKYLSNFSRRSHPLPLHIEGLRDDLRLFAMDESARRAQCSATEFICACQSHLLWSE